MNNNMDKEISSQNVIELLQKCITTIDKDKHYNIKDLKELLSNIYYNNDDNDKKEVISTKLIAFTDGACNFNGKKNALAGYAVVFPNNRIYDFSERLTNNHTNNRAEYSAVIKALEIANNINPDNKETLYIYTDSELLINSVTKWIKAWKKNNWVTAKKTSVLNKDLLIIIDKYLITRVVIFKHVRAHTNNNDWESFWNNIADLEAKKTLYKDVNINYKIDDSVVSSNTYYNTRCNTNNNNNELNNYKKKPLSILKQFGIK